MDIMLKILMVFLFSLIFPHSFILLSVECTLLNEMLRILDFVLDEKDKTLLFPSVTDCTFYLFLFILLSFLNL